MFQRQFWCGVVIFALAVMAQAQTYIQFKTVDGRTFNGRPVSVKDDSLQIALEGGGYTNLSWGRMSQGTLKELASKKTPPNLASYASVFIDPPRSDRGGEAAKPKKVTLKEVPRMDRPADGNLFASPVMLFLLVLLYGANIYAGYEISVFRQQPPALVCVVAAIAPIVGPAIFLAMPTRQPPEEQPVMAAEPEQVIEEAPVVVEEAPAPVAEPETPAIPQPVVYARGQFTFNRRFFETKFAGFLKMVPGEAERDKVIAIKSARGDYVGQRFSKLEPNEAYLQVKKGNASEDVMLPYSEIYEIVIKHKDT